MRRLIFPPLCQLAGSRNMSEETNRHTRPTRRRRFTRAANNAQSTLDFRHSMPLNDFQRRDIAAEDATFQRLMPAGETGRASRRPRQRRDVWRVDAIEGTPTASLPLDADEARGLLIEICVAASAPLLYAQRPSMSYDSLPTEFDITPPCGITRLYSLSLPKGCWS